MVAGFVAITFALLAINFNINNLNKNLELLIEVFTSDFDEEEDD